MIFERIHVFFVQFLKLYPSLECLADGKTGSGRKDEDDENLVKLREGDRDKEVKTSGMEKRSDGGRRGKTQLVSNRRIGRRNTRS